MHQSSKETAVVHSAHQLTNGAIREMIQSSAMENVEFAAETMVNGKCKGTLQKTPRS